MKNFLRPIITGFLLMFTLGCQQQPNPEHVATIAPASLSDETKRIITGLMLDQVKVLDVDKNTELVTTMYAFVERFEKGVKQEQELDMGMEIRKKSQLLFAYDWKEQEDEKEHWLRMRASVIDGGSIGATEKDVIFKGSRGGSVTHQLSMSKPIKLNQPLTVMAVLEDNKQGIIFREQLVTQYDETGELPSEFLEYDRVILFRVKLMEGRS
ncbi:hypothetical protein [Ammoniphilus sp. YIM 78166]|uniref:hypothetical protein n=2 Tax=Ammoniphilus sp. YIM 78166 TaxID=1644106 RepID=UPI00107016A7|nr:hypothetical protein [Ammoniphilus sp. YIM 78166]